MPHQILSEQEEQSVSNGSTVKISVMGAGGGIGQSLSLLLKTQLDGDRIQLALYDVNDEAVIGLGADLSHIDTDVQLSFHGKDDVAGALQNTNLVVIPAGVPRKPGMTRDDLFHINARIVQSIGHDIAQHTNLDNVFILLISNPVNSLVPVLVSTLSQYNPNACSRVFGITELDMVRANTFTHLQTEIPVIGGHSGETIVPVLSKLPTLDPNSYKDIVHRIQFGGDEIVKAKNGKGSATFSMAYAAFKVIKKKFVPLLLQRIHHFEGTFYISLLNPATKQPTCPDSLKLLSLIEQTPYFGIPMTVTLQKGITNLLYNIINELNEYERTHLLPICIQHLQKNIASAVA